MKNNGLKVQRTARGVGSLVIASLLVVGCSSTEGSENTAQVAESREISHARGETSVPANAERIVVLEPVQLDTVVALDRIPVGAAVLNETLGVPDYLGDDAGDIASVGTVTEPNVEAIAALEPDLILGTESRHSEIYQQLEAIAPTVYLTDHTNPWQDSVRMVAETLGETAKGEEVLQKYDDRCSEVDEALGDEPRTAQLIRPRDDSFSLYGPDSFAGSTLLCAGYELPERDWDDILVDVSEENLGSAAADLVLVTSVDPSDQSTMPETVTSSVERSSDTGQVELVDQSTWITGVGPLGGQAVLDDLEAIGTGAGQ